MDGIEWCAATLIGFPVEIGCMDPRSQKRDPPNFLYVVLDRTACAPFYTERRIECAEPTKLRRKSGTWGTHHLIQRFSRTLSSCASFPDACFSPSVSPCAALCSWGAGRDGPCHWILFSSLLDGPD